MLIAWTVGFVGQTLKQAKVGEAVRGAWAEETRNRPSLGCQRAIAHLFATLVRLNELNSFEFMNFFLQVSHSAESDWNNGRMPKNALYLARFMRFKISLYPHS